MQPLSNKNCSRKHVDVFHLTKSSVIFPLQMKKNASPGGSLTGGHCNEQPRTREPLSQPRDLYYKKPLLLSTAHCEFLEVRLMALLCAMRSSIHSPHMQLDISYFSFPQLLHVHQGTYHYRHHRCPLDPRLAI